MQLDILDPHPFLERFRFMRHRRAVVGTGTLSLAIFLVAAAADGNLLQGSLKQVLCQDARSYVQAGDGICGGYEFSQRMSALRDVGSLAVVVLLPLTIPLMFRQWTGITHFLSAMDDRGILKITDRGRVEQEVRACNDFFRRFAAWNPVVCLLSVLSMLFVTRAQAEGTVYPILQVSNEKFGVASDSWWASLVGSTTVGLLYFSVGFIVVYIILLQNIHGSRVVFLLWRLRKLVSYEADISNTDGSFGWSEVRAILFATWSLTIIHGICLSLVALSLPSGHAAALAPLLLQWLVVTPFYLFVPVWLTKKNIGSWKSQQRALLLSQKSNTTSRAIKSQVLQQVRQLNQVKVNPYAGVIRRTFHYLGIIGSIALVVQVIQYVYK